MPRSFHLLPARPLTTLGSAALALSLAGGLALGVAASGPASAAVHSVRSVHSVEKSKKKSTKSTTTTTTNASVADNWLIKAIGAENKLGSVKINGTVVQGKTTIKLSLLVNGDGEGGGTFIQQGSKIQLKRVGPLLYFDAPKSFWLHSSTATEAAKYGGKWIEVSALDSRFESFDQFLDAGDLVTAVFQGHTTPLSVSKPTTFEGHKVVIVSDKITVKGKTSSGTMYIEATGKPYVLKFVDKGPTQHSNFSFSSYGKAVGILTPPEPIDLT